MKVRQYTWIYYCTVCPIEAFFYLFLLWFFLLIKVSKKMQKYNVHVHRHTYKHLPPYPSHSSIFHHNLKPSVCISKPQTGNKKEWSFSLSLSLYLSISLSISISHFLTLYLTHTHTYTHTHTHTYIYIYIYIYQPNPEKCIS